MSTSATANLLQRFAMPPLRTAAVLIGFTVPISVALDNVLLALLLTGILFNARAIRLIATQHPVARAAWLLFAVLFVSMFYGATPLREALGILGKYIDLALIPLFMLMFSGETIKRQAQYAFIAAMSLTLLLSYAVGFELLAVQPWMSAFGELIPAPQNPVIFHSHLTQSNMMAFAAFLALLNARDAVALLVKAAWGLFALLASINVLFVVQGRTGYVILLALLGWSAWTTLARHAGKRNRQWGWRQAAAISLVCIGMAVSAYFVSARLHDRVTLMQAEYQGWRDGQSDEFSSIGKRLNFYRNTLQIVRQQPVQGIGIGGFPAAFAQQTQGKNVTQTRNPHNEYLMITVQTGVIGLALLLYLFYTQWRYAPLLDTAFKQDAARGLVLAYIVNCSFNSALLDHSDGLFFAFMTAVLFSGLSVEKKIG